MVFKEFCDVCMKEMPIPRDPDFHALRGRYLNRTREYRTCQTCVDAIERYIRELNDKYRLMDEFKKSPLGIKSQKELGDFE